MITILILIGLIASISSQPLHEAITSEDLKSLFSVESITEVPNYDVVPISIVKPRNRRDSWSFLFQKPFGDQIYMWLNPLNGTLASRNTPFWTIKSTSNITEPTIRNWHDVIEDNLDYLYSNTEHATTLAVNNHANGKYTVEGFIGSKYIKPIPSHLIEHARKHRKSVNKVVDIDMIEKIYHIVQDTRKPEIIKELIDNILKPKTNLTSLTIYPEVLVIIDYELNKIICQDITKCFLYIVAFWNGVDMKYRSLENPKIRLNIAGIIVAEDEDVLPYMKEYSPESKSPLYLQGEALEYKGEWLYEMDHMFPIDSYDIAITMMPHTLCPTEDYTNCSGLGLASGFGACGVDDNEYWVKKVAFVQDNGAYEGIHTAVHEVGHLFGAFHDGDFKICNSSDGYIMTPTADQLDHVFDWSNCSLLTMDEFLRSDAAECLRNEPASDDRHVLRYLPGKLIDANGQCEILKKGKASFINATICKHLTCTEEKFSNPLIGLQPAAEGTSCGDGKLCLQGQCTFETSVM